MLVTAFVRFSGLNYYCSMSKSQTMNANSEIVLEDSSRFSYIIKPFELRNALGNIVALLKEYIFTTTGENNQPFSYKLYRTKDESWYEISDANSGAETTLLRALKTAIDRKEFNR